MTIWPTHTPVRHKTLGFIGWVHATTKMKEIFTGDTTVEWQYTIRVEGENQMKAAPPSDLEWINAKAPFPSYVLYKESVSDKNYLQETRLHALGYQISDLNFEERWLILQFVALPMLGAKEVVRTIVAVISSRLKQTSSSHKFRFAFKEWNRDLNAIAETTKGSEDYEAIRSAISYIQGRLLEAKMIDAKEALCVNSN